MELDKDAQKTIGGLGKLETKLNNLGKSLSTMVTLPLALAGAAVTKFASDFDGGMRKVTSLLGGVTQEKFEHMSAQVLELSKRLGIDAVSATEALYEAISAAVPEENAIQFLEDSSKAAIAGVTDTRIAVHSLTTIIAAYNLKWSEASEVADAMFQSVNRGKFNFEQLASAIGPAAQQANNLGISYKELLAATATLSITSGGVGVAVTQIESAMRALLNATPEMQKALEGIGFSTGSAAVKALGFHGTLEELRKKTHGSAEAFNALFGRIEGATGALGLTGDKFKAAGVNIDYLNRSAGMTAKAMGEIEKSAPRQFQKALNELKVVGIEMGNILLPTVKDLLKAAKPMIQFLGDMVKWFTELPTPVKNATAAFLAFSFALGPVVQGLNALIFAVPRAIVETKTLVQQLELLGITTNTLAIGLKALPWVALAAGIYGVLTALSNTETAKSNLAQAMEKEKTALDGLKTKWREHQVLLGNIAPTVNEAKETVLDFIKGLDKVKSAAKVGGDGINLFEEAVRKEMESLKEADKVARIHEEAMRRLGKVSKGAATEITSFNTRVADMLADMPLSFQSFSKAVEDGMLNPKTAIKQLTETLSDAMLKWKVLPETVQQSVAETWRALEKIKDWSKQLEVDNLAKGLTEGLRNLVDATNNFEDLQGSLESLAGVKFLNLSQAGKDIDELELSMQNFGMESQAALRNNSQVLEQSLAHAKLMHEQYGNAVVSSRELVNLQLRLVQAKIDEGIQTGANISKLLEQEEALKNSLQLVVNMATKMKFAFAEAFKEFGGNLVRGAVDLVKSLFNDDFNKDLQRQTADLKKALNERARDLEEFASQTQQRIAELQQEYADRIEQETRDLRKGLKEREDAYEDFAAEVSEQMREVTAANRKELQRSLDQLRAALDDRERAYSEYVREVGRKEQEIRRNAAESLRSQLADLKRNLDERSQAYDDYAREATSKLDKIQQDLYYTLANGARDFNRSIEDEQRNFARDQRSLSEQLREAEAAGDVERTEDIRRQLQERSQDHAITMARLQEDNALRVAEAQRAAAEETSTLQTELAARQREYDAFVKQMQERQIEVERINSESLHKQLTDLQRGLDQQTELIEQSRLKYKETIQQVTDEANLQLQKQLADLQKSLAERTKDLEKYRQHVEQQIVEMRVKYQEEQEREVAALLIALQEKRDAYEAFKLDVLDKLKELEEAHRGFADRVGKMFEGIFVRALESLGNLVGSILWDKLEQKLKRVLFASDAASSVAAGKPVSNAAANALGGDRTYEETLGGQRSPTAMAGAGSGSASSAISSVLTGYVAPISAAITAISGIVSNFQFAHMNTALGRIEESTRYTKILTENLVDKALTYWPNLQTMHQFNYDVAAPWMARVEGLLERMAGGVSSPFLNGMPTAVLAGAGGGVSINIQGNTFRNQQDIDYMLAQINQSIGQGGAQT